MTALSTRSPALWNRSQVDLRSDETVAQLLEWGSLEEWRELFRIASADPGLRARIVRLVRRVPLTYAGFWLAALGEPAEWPARWPEEAGI